MSYLSSYIDLCIPLAYCAWLLPFPTEMELGLDIPTGLYIVWTSCVMRVEALGQPNEISSSLVLDV